MDVREKLVELPHKGVRCPGVIDNCNDCPHHSLEKPCDEFGATVDMLIAHGVTVPEWISVTDSPKGKGCYVVAAHHWLDGKPVTREAYWNGCGWLSCDKKWELTQRVTHWQYLPQPPKGE